MAGIYIHVPFCESRCAAPYIHRGQLIHTDDNHLRLTPESIFISDAVMCDLLY